ATQYTVPIVPAVQPLCSVHALVASHTASPWCAWHGLADRLPWAGPGKRGGLERAVQARVTGWNSRPEKTTCVRRSVKTSMPQTGRAEEQTCRVQIFAA